MLRFRDISVERKFFILFGTAVLFMGLIIMVGVVHMLWMKDSSVKIYEESLLEAGRLSEVKSDFDRARRTVLMMLSEPDRARLESYMNEIAAATGKIDANIGKILSSARPGTEIKAGTLKLKGIWAEYKETRDSLILPWILEGSREKAAEAAVRTQEPRLREFSAVVASLIERRNAEAFEAQRALKRTFARGLVLYAVLSAAGLAVSIAFMLNASRDIGRRFKTIMQAIQKFDTGELDLKIDAEGKDELGSLAASLNRMFRRLFEDNFVHEQYMNVLSWNTIEMEEKTAELETVNKTLSGTKGELETKNKRLEESVSELKTVNQKLADTRAQMLQSEKMASIGQLAAGVAHEINNPVGFVSSNLNTLSGYVGSFSGLIARYQAAAAALRAKKYEEASKIIESVEEFKKDSDVDFAMADTAHLMEESKDGLERIKAIVKGLKDFSHPAGEDMEMSDINACLENAVRLSWHEVKYKAELEKDLRPAPPVLCRPQQLTQVFLNMIINAVQAIPEKGTISIRSMARGNQAVVEIKDNGVGMPEDVLKKIFDPFFTTKPVGKGTGLGLAIAYGIVSEHRGEISVESRPGEGTTFTISLPAGAEAYGLTG